MHVILCLVFCGLLLAASSSDDGNVDVANLETQRLQQAATIQALEARLDAQEAIIQSLQSNQSIQQNTINDTVTKVRSLEQRQTSQETLQQQQAAAIQSQQASLQQQTATLLQQDSKLQTVLKKQSEVVAFHVNFGQIPFHDLYASTSPLRFNHVQLNVGNGFDISTGIFTAPFNGVYSFTLYYLTSAHAATTELGIYCEHSLLAAGMAEGGFLDSNDQGSCTAVTHLTTGQRVFVLLYFGQPLIHGSVDTSFTGILVHSD